MYTYLPITEFQIVIYIQQLIVNQIYSTLYPNNNPKTSHMYQIPLPNKDKNGWWIFKYSSM